MNRKSAIIGIPVEYISIQGCVEYDNPLKIPANAIETAEEEKPFSEALCRLDALSRTFTSSTSHSVLFNKTIIRDLWKGEIWHPKETSLSVDSEKCDVKIIEPQICLMTGSDAENKVSDLLYPYKSFLQRHSGLLLYNSKSDWLPNTRLCSFNSSSNIDYIPTKVRNVKNQKNHERWIPEQGPFKKLIQNHIDDIPGFEAQIPVSETQKNDWPFAPEIEALRKLEEVSDDIRIDVARNIANSILEEIRDDKRARLDLASPVVGFRKDMWSAMETVIRSSDKYILILSSFTNQKHIEKIASRISDAARGGNREIMLAFGEPDRGREADEMEKTERFIASLQNGCEVNISGGVSPKPNHVKIAISDKGKVFICSCNLFSGSLQSSVLESGLVITGYQCAIKMVNVLHTEGWIPDSISEQTQHLVEALEKRPDVHYELAIENEIQEIKEFLKGNDSVAQNATEQLKTLLRRVAERPIWHVLKSLDHRPFMNDCIDRFNQYLVMASDGLSSNGLDKATIRKIDNRARDVASQKSKPNVYVWWGRDTPGSPTDDDDSERKRADAKSRLFELRKCARNSWWFLPWESNEPMETHAKMFIVDNSRLMLSSDNTLSFGDTEIERDDAGELGIVIDHPRLARQMRGNMEMWLPTARVNGDANRWWAALAKEVNRMVKRPDEKVSLREALNAMTDGINFEHEHDEMRKDWMSFEDGAEEHIILRKLALGMKYGLFYLSGNDQQRININRLTVDKTNISLIQNLAWQKKAKSQP